MIAYNNDITQDEVNKMNYYQDENNRIKISSNSCEVVSLWFKIETILTWVLRALHWKTLFLHYFMRRLLYFVFELDCFISTSHHRLFLLFNISLIILFLDVGFSLISNLFNKLHWFIRVFLVKIVIVISNTIPDLLA